MKVWYHDKFQEQQFLATISWQLLGMISWCIRLGGTQGRKKGEGEIRELGRRGRTYLWSQPSNIRWGHHHWNSTSWWRWKSNILGIILKVEQQSIERSKVLIETWFMIKEAPLPPMLEFITVPVYLWEFLFLQESGYLMFCETLLQEQILIISGGQILWLLPELIFK